MTSPNQGGALPKKAKPAKPPPPGHDALEQDRFDLLLVELQGIRRKQATTNTANAASLSLLERIMATVAELTQKLTDLQTAVDAAEQRADDRDAALQTKLDALQAAYDALIAGGADIPQALMDAAQASIDDLNAFAAVETPPITPPETPVP